LNGEAGREARIANFGDCVKEASIVYDLDSTIGFGHHIMAKARLGGFRQYPIEDGWGRIYFFDASYCSPSETSSPVFNKTSGYAKGN